MAGGLLNIIAYGEQNMILNGNPTRTFFKSTYSKYTNFGMQKFKIQQIGNKELSLTQSTHFTFKIERLGDLLMDTYLCVNLPNIWSPIFKSMDGTYRPYEFKWIENLGTQIIKKVKLSIGGHIIQEFTGTYLQNMVERDFTQDKRELFNKMIGNIPDLNNPALLNNGNYPNAFNYDGINTDLSGIIPSIKGQQLYIPLNCWFCLMSKMAFPLVCLQYSEFVMEFELRPIYELYTVNDVDYSGNSFINNDTIKRIQPYTTREHFNFIRFINPPPIRDISLSNVIYNNKNVNFDIHLLCNYCFLDNEEVRLFAQTEQKYLIKNVYEKNYNIANSNSGKISIETNGLVSNWMWFLQRNDVNKRNEWSNYTNYQYKNKPPNSLNLINNTINNGSYHLPYYNNIIGRDLSINLYTTAFEPDRYNDSNIETILDKFAIICDGKYRENDFNSGLYEYIEKYIRTNGNAKNGLYCYNFGVTNDPLTEQPTGSFNTNKFKHIEFEYKLKNRFNGEPLNSFDFSGVQVQTVCDNDNNIVIQVKDATSVFKYSFNFYLMEERYNILLFNSGYADLVYSR